MVHIVGIDCAADPSDIAVVSARPAGECLMIDSAFRGQGGKLSRSSRLCLLAHRIAEEISQDHSTLLAIDAPLGWPIIMGQALSTHLAGSPLPEPCAKSFFRRRTDRIVEARTGKTPIEVGANLIARVSHTALRLLAMLGNALDGRLTAAPLTSPTELGSDVQVIEVYPALASPFFLDCSHPRAEAKKPTKPADGDPRRRCWDTLSKNLQKLKAQEWQAIQEQILEHLRIDASRCRSRPKFWSSAPSRDHGLDAILCAWTACRFLRGKCVHPDEYGESESISDHLSREGWIWFDERTRISAGAA